MAPSRPELQWALDREIVLARVFDFPRERVFRAWTEIAHFGKWFGPAGFTCSLRETAEAKVGATWRFDLIAPNGHKYENRIVLLEIKPPELLVFDHGYDRDDDPGRFRVTLTFREQSDKKTVMTLRQLHPTKAHHDTAVGFGAVELGYQTLDKLEAYLRKELGPA